MDADTKDYLKRVVNLMENLNQQIVILENGLEALIKEVRK